MLTVYGIKSCDTVRRARRWLEAHGVDYRYHDLREDGLDASRLAAWIEAVGVEALVNRRSTAWRSLPAPARAAFDGATAREQLLRQPTLLKRPILDTGSSLHSGFSAGDWARLLAMHTL